MSVYILINLATLLKILWCMCSGLMSNGATQSFFPYCVGVTKCLSDVTPNQLGLGGHCMKPCDSYTNEHQIWLFNCTGNVCSWMPVWQRFHFCFPTRPSFIMAIIVFYTAKREQLHRCQRNLGTAWPQLASWSEEKNLSPRVPHQSSLSRNVTVVVFYSFRLGIQQGRGESYSFLIRRSSVLLSASKVKNGGVVK